MLDIDYLFSGPSTSATQARNRQRMTEAVYRDKRQERLQAFLWLAVAMAHVLIVTIAFCVSREEMLRELAQAPGAIIGLALWLGCDMVYISCFPKLYGDIQHELDRLEGKISS
jgi:hypothetical protein